VDIRITAVPRPEIDVDLYVLGVIEFARELAKDPAAMEEIRQLVEAEKKPSSWRERKTPGGNTDTKPLPPK
jgi:hypothetical protein